MFVLARQTNSTTPSPPHKTNQPNKQKPQKQKPNKKEAGHIFIENLASLPSQPLQVKDAHHPLLMIFTAICVFSPVLVSEYSAN